MSAKGKIIINEEQCKGCGLCVDVCPNKNIYMGKSMNRKGYSTACFQEHPDKGQKGCTACTLCALVCPDTTIEVYRAK